VVKQKRCPRKCGGTLISGLLEDFCLTCGYQDYGDPVQVPGEGEPHNKYTPVLPTGDTGAAERYDEINRRARGKRKQEREARERQTPRYSTRPAV